MASDDPLDRLARGETPATIALMQLLWGVESHEAAKRRVEAALSRFAGDPDAERRLDDALQLLRTHPDAFRLIGEVLQTVQDPQPGATPEASIADYASGFDRAAALSPEAGVALYSLGDPALLQEVTREIVGRMRDWGLLGPDRRVLEVGCGAGRFLVALAPEVAHVTGAEISPGMAAVARERTAGLANVKVVASSGQDLAYATDASLDLALFADSFPYVVQAGGDLPARHFAECARVLRPGGRLLILNYSYRGDLAHDRADAEALAAAVGLELTLYGPSEFKLWDGAAFLFRRRLGSG